VLNRLQSEPLLDFWSNFMLPTLARVNLSFIPMVEMLDRSRANFRDVGSFGSGSCTHEVALALLFDDIDVFCYDARDSYIPVWTKPYFDHLSRLHFELYDFSRPLDVQFDLVISIQTLEHIEDFQSALDMLARSVRPGGYLYVDTPVFHEEPDREPDIDAHRERAWRNNEHYHLGFSRTRMEQRLADRGLNTVNSGYYSYAAGDHAVMRYVKDSQEGRAEKAQPTTIRALNRALWTSLTGCERAFAPRRDEIDSLLLKQRVCFAYRILAQRPVTM
jgi:SAM-dependent methyltransferase